MNPEFLKKIKRMECLHIAMNPCVYKLDEKIDEKQKHEMEQTLGSPLPEIYMDFLSELGILEIVGKHLVLKMFMYDDFVMDGHLKFGGTTLKEVFAFGEDDKDYIYFYDMSDTAGKGKDAIFRINHDPPGWDHAEFVAKLLEEIVEKILDGVQL